MLESLIIGAAFVLLLLYVGHMGPYETRDKQKEDDD